MFDLQNSPHPCKRLPLPFPVVLQTRAKRLTLVVSPFFREGSEEYPRAAGTRRGLPQPLWAAE